MGGSLLSAAWNRFIIILVKKEKRSHMTEKKGDYCAIYSGNFLFLWWLFFSGGKLALILCFDKVKHLLRAKEKKSISVVQVVCFDISPHRQWASRRRFISLLMKAEDGALYLRKLWQVQIFPMFIKVVAITVLRTPADTSLEFMLGRRSQVWIAVWLSSVYNLCIKKASTTESLKTFDLIFWIYFF